MIVAVDLAALTEQVRAEAKRHPARSPERRAAGHLWIALANPPATSLDAARRAVASFGTPHSQAGALALLHRLAATAATAPKGQP